MPNIRIVNWNIEQLSGNKVGIAGMATNIGKIIANTNADIAIILEVRSATAIAAMTAVSAAANAASVVIGGAANDYTGWLISYATGNECYGVLIKNLNVIRPIHVAGGPTGANTDDGANAALSNLDANQFSTWPGPFIGAGAVADAYAGGLPAAAARPNLPLIDLFSRTRPTGRKRRRFAGRTLAAGGYALGIGFRMPCLAMFEILDGAGAATYLIPVLTCHLGAVRGGANHLARAQVEQYKETDISQKFQNGGYIDLNNAPEAIQELIITGDFNLDFLNQTPPVAPDFVSALNRAAYNTITPTSTNGGSAAPAATPGAPALPAPGVPFVPPAVGWPQGPICDTIPDQALKTANTTVGTILHHYVAGVVPANIAALRGAAFDNLFFGGVQLSANYQVLTPGPPADACETYDIPTQITQAPVAAATLDVQGAYLHHLVAGTRNAAAAPNLFVGIGPMPPLTTNDRLIGARFISDHLPNLIQVNLP